MNAPRRLYERWPGRIQPLCFGRFILSKDATRTLPMTLMAMLLPLCLFSLFQWPNFYQYFYLNLLVESVGDRTSDQQLRFRFYSLVGFLLFAWLLISCMISLACCVILTDPGIYPNRRCIHFDEDENCNTHCDTVDDDVDHVENRVVVNHDRRHKSTDDEKYEDTDVDADADASDETVQETNDDHDEFNNDDVDDDMGGEEKWSKQPLLPSSVTTAEKKSPKNVMNNESPQALSLLPIAPLYQSVLVGERETRLKYCATCQIYRPTSLTNTAVSHCKKCNHCVEGFDHHCTFLGQCIGKRNHGVFYQFIVVTWIALLLFIAVCMTHIGIVCTTKRISLAQMIHRVILSSILLFYSTSTSLFIGALVLLHSYLLISNQTTAQFVKRYRSPHAYNCGRGDEEQSQLMTIKDSAFKILCTLVCGHLLSLRHSPRRVNFRGRPCDHVHELIEVKNSAPPNDMDVELVVLVGEDKMGTMTRLTQ